MLLHPVHDDLIRIRLPSLTKKFDDNKIKDADGCIVLNKIELLQRAQKYNQSIEKQYIIFILFSFRCYMQAIRLKPRSPVHWSCLAQCVYIQSRLNSDDQRMLTLASEYLKIAISLKPNDYLLWNALGVVAAHPGRSIKSNNSFEIKLNIFFLQVLNECAFAQHCFFKSIQFQRSAIAYANLGFVYYRFENLTLANQQTDPAYPLAWIGQVIKQR